MKGTLKVTNIGLTQVPSKEPVPEGQTVGNPPVEVFTINMSLVDEEGSSFIVGGAPGSASFTFTVDDISEVAVGSIYDLVITKKAAAKAAPSA